VMKWTSRPSHQYQTGIACGRPSGRVVEIQIVRLADNVRSMLLHGMCPGISKP
jgi:ribosomal protein S14